MNRFPGRCHCGAIAVLFETARPAAEIQVRACVCSFCRKHGARAVTDPAGRLTVTSRAVDDLRRYRFGRRTADFLICARCGVYVAAILTEAAGTWATLDLNVLNDAAAFTQPPIAVDYGVETADERRARRRARWTPARLVIGEP
jgi:hypothetical protein